jgi:hypothetical protein
MSVSISRLATSKFEHRRFAADGVQPSPSLVAAVAREEGVGAAHVVLAAIGQQRMG